MVSAIDKWTLWHILKERTALVNGTERNHLYVCLRNDDEYLIMGDLELQVWIKSKLLLAFCHSILIHRTHLVNGTR